MWRWIRISHVRATVLCMEKQNPLRTIIPTVLTIILASKHLHTPLELSRNRAAPGSDLISVYSLRTKRWYALASSRWIFQKEPIAIVQGKSLAWRSILKFLQANVQLEKVWELTGAERGSSRSSSQCLTVEIFFLCNVGTRSLARWLHLTLISSSGWMRNVYSLHAGVGLLLRKAQFLPLVRFVANAWFLRRFLLNFQTICHEA